LRENLVDKSHVGGEVILVYMEGEEAADIAEPSNDQDRRLFGHSRELWWSSRNIIIVRERGVRMRAQMSRRRRRKNGILEGEVQTDYVHLNFECLARCVGSVLSLLSPTDGCYVRNIESECSIETRLFGFRGQRVTAE
jgi:hypothetical protein